jgi:hypothetical protein
LSIGKETRNVVTDVVNRLVWGNGCSQSVKSPIRGDKLLDVYLVRPESLLTSCSLEEEMSDHCGVFLEAEWKLITVDLRLVPVYNEADTLGLQTFLQDEFPMWAING